MMPSTANCKRITFSGQAPNNRANAEPPARRIDRRTARPTLQKHHLARLVAHRFDQLAGQLAMLVIHQRHIQQKRAVGHHDQLAAVVAPIVRRRRPHERGMSSRKSVRARAADLKSPESWRSAFAGSIPRAHGPEILSLLLPERPGTVVNHAHSNSFGSRLARFCRVLFHKLSVRLGP